MNPLSVQLYSLRDQMSDPRAVLTKLAEIGYGAIEPYSPTTDPAGFRAIADELGLKVSSTHAPVLGEKRDEVLDAMATIGTDTVIVPATAPERWTDREGVEGVAAELNETAKHVAARGMRIGYHNHWWELENVVDGRPALEVFADALDPELILEVDIYWAAVGGVDVPDLLTRLGERVHLLHVKDGPATKGDPMTAVGGGVVPIKASLAAGKSVEWHVVELDECATDMVQALADSYAFLTAGGAR